MIIKSQTCCSKVSLKMVGSRILIILVADSNMWASWTTYKGWALNTSHTFKERAEAFTQVKQVHCLKHNSIKVLLTVIQTDW